MNTSFHPDRSDTRSCFCRTTPGEISQEKSSGSLINKKLVLKTTVISGRLLTDDYFVLSLMILQRDKFIFQ